MCPCTAPPTEIEILAPVSASVIHFLQLQAIEVVPGGTCMQRFALKARIPDASSLDPICM